MTGSNGSFRVAGRAKSEAIPIASQLATRSPVLLPWPRHIESREGWLILDALPLESAFDNVVTERLRKAIARLSQQLRQLAGSTASSDATIASEGAAAVTILIDVAHAGERYPGPDEDESYQLDVSRDGVVISAASEFGALRALATVAQLASRTLDDQLGMPFVHIEDAPRFPWRGLLLDSARHFLDIEVLLRTLDGMASCKMNVLHLHLTDDQGYRLPSSAFPELPSTRHYSASELREVIEHAADLGIRVVPELDMPGHVTSWLTAYPQWGSATAEATTRFGVHKACLDPTRDEIFLVIDQLIAELTEIFPDACVHIGGDEVHPAWWSQNQRVTEFMREHDMSDVHDLQAYFNQRVGALVEARGRQVVAWDEVQHPDLPAHWIVQAWRGATARDRLLVQGNRVIMSGPYYLDLHYPVDVYYDFDPRADQADLVEREDRMLEDPRLKHVAEGMRWTQQWRRDAVQMTELPADGVLGAEACLWGELVNSELLDQRLWSRLPALAERFWSGAALADVGSLRRRLQAFQRSSLTGCGIDLEQTLNAQLTALGIVESWQALARLLEPVKWYGRLLGEQALAARLAGEEMPQARPYGTETPLDKLSDVLPPESQSWWAIEDLLSEAAAVQDVLEGWRRTLQLNCPVVELVPFLPAFGALADLVEHRLAGKPIAEASIDAIGVPHGELMLSLSPGLRTWLLEVP